VYGCGRCLGAVSIRSPSAQSHSRDVTWWPQSPQQSGQSPVMLCGVQVVPQSGHSQGWPSASSPMPGRLVHLCRVIASSQVLQSAEDISSRLIFGRPHSSHHIPDEARSYA
jgi:hypothetical protein